MTTIFREMDIALRDEMMKLATAPRDTQFVFVLSTAARNDLFEAFLQDRWRTTTGKTLSEEKYRDVVIAVTADETMPRVSIFTKARRQ